MRWPFGFVLTYFRCSNKRSTLYRLPPSSLFCIACQPVQKWQLIIAAIGLGVGGLGGAIFKALWDEWKNRIQPVGRRIEIIPILKPPTTKAGFETYVVVNQLGEEKRYYNLFLMDIEIFNRGNQHRQQFDFGITLQPGEQAINIEPDTPDRHHTVTHTQTSITQPQNSIDFTLKPFNRSDRYQLKVYVTIPTHSTNPSLPRFSSEEPVRFTDIKSLTETLAESIEVSALRFGPLSFRIFRD